MKEWGGEKKEVRRVVRKEWSFETAHLFAHTCTKHNTTPHNKTIYMYMYTHSSSQCADSCGGRCRQCWPVGGGFGILHSLHQRQHLAEERAGQE